MFLHDRFPLHMADSAPADGGSGAGSAGASDQGAPSPPGPPAPDARATSLLQAGQEGSLLDYRSGLPENVRQAPIVTRHATLEAAMKSLIAQDEMIGRGLFLPKEEPGTEAHAAAMQKVYDKLGRPGKAADYTLAAPEGRTMDTEVAGRWQKAFYAAGLSQAQVGEVMTEYWRTVEYAENVRAGAEARGAEEGRKALYGEFGASTQDMLLRANSFFEFFGEGAFGGKAGQEAWKQLHDARLPDGRRLTDSPEVIAAFAEAGKRLAEGEYKDSGFWKPGTDTMETMQKEFDQLQVKRHAGTMTPAEMDRHQLVRNQLSAARERQATGRR